MKLNLPLVAGIGLLAYLLLSKKGSAAAPAPADAPPVELPFVPAEDISQVHWGGGIPEQTANALALQSLNTNAGQWTGQPFTGSWGASSWGSGGPLF